MKKIIALVTFATCLLVVANAQTPSAKKEYTKETAKILKQLSPAAQQRVFEYAERELKVQEAMAQKPLANAPTPPPPASTRTEPASAPTPPPPPATADPHAGHDHAAPLPAVTPATSPNSDSPEYMVRAEKMPKTTIKWDKDSHDFGKITEGEKVSHRFTFKNTGSNPLLMTMVKPSCGCTASNWSKEEIAPGGEGFVDLEFNSAGKSGVQRKNVTVYLNAEPIMQYLTFMGEVVVTEK